jgi:hypothetical protein
VPLVVDAETCLPLERYTSKAKLDYERVLVDRFRISGSEMPMHFDGSIDHPPRKVIHLRWGLPEPRFVLGRIRPIISGSLRPPRPWCARPSLADLVECEVSTM